MNKEMMVDAYTMNYYSALKKEILPFATTSMNWEDIVLSEISRHGKKTLHALTYMWN